MSERQAWDYCSILSQLDFGSRDKAPLSVQDVKMTYDLYYAEINSKGEVERSVADALVSLRNLTQIYGQLASWVTDSRRFFKTEGGHLGLGPQEAQKGDQVWLICDARVPFVLRPTPKEDTFTLVGDTHVHDLMHGEMLDDSYGLKDMIGPIHLIWHAKGNEPDSPYAFCYSSAEIFLTYITRPTR